MIGGAGKKGRNGAKVENITLAVEWMHSQCHCKEQHLLLQLLPLLHIFKTCFGELGLKLELLVSSEGALYVILPYDYPAQQRAHFLNTHWSLITTWSINAMMTLVTMISIMTKFT